ncbi:Beta-lactamase-like protein [Kalmanozyma brasiliensis GHG001]|uniref:Metallo-beta-lactamase domain-containing protein n=1 Tax=Kalmanozyma brasiliensis (strain GHG001) TaxID=1365824 RepID=V5E668_KALBG|nr:Beta-lactamase-like protein [Kalmanozyma brasiliensis GHG001]EST05741.1 Beta-lactamase-like protein [Kalmanozyma brasiliensis GHG001]
MDGNDRPDGVESVSSSRSSTSSDDNAPTANGGPSKPRTTTPYEIKLHCRSNDPIADLDALDPEDLPSHWVPTFVSQLSRAKSSAFGQLPTGRSSTSSDRSSPKEPKRSKTEETHMLSRLTFVNPWEKSFRKPGIQGILNGGLKWGLPDSYTEGDGHGGMRASGFKSNKKILRQMEEARKEGLREDWDKVEVIEPGWGWSSRRLKKEVDHIRDEDGELSPQHEQSKTKTSESDYKSKERPQQDWKDPKTSRDAVRVTWLGHATTLLQLPPLPTESNANGQDGDDVSSRSINILFDPIFSERCSPSQSAGPQRFTPAPCTVEDLPPIDFVIISHSHYDHLDYHTFKQLHHLRGQSIHAIVPLGVKDKLTGTGGFGWSKDQVSELDWWDSASLTLPSSSGEVKVVCTPAQHGSGRGAGDKDASLWASWVVSYHSSNERFCAFFAGDTGLKFHHDNPNKRHKYPACPAFAEIARKFQPFDLLLLPISVGSSLSYFRSWDPFPRAFSPFPRVSSTLTSSIHMDPFDAVECHEIFQREKKEGKDRGMVSLAVHYGTFVRNDEQTRGDVRELHKACRMKGLRFARVSDETLLLNGGEAAQGEGEERKIEGKQEKKSKDEDVFLVSDQGQTVWLPIHSS